MTESSDYESVQVFIGVDVGKDTHHAVAINRSGKRLFDKALPNDENKLRSLISDLKQHGQILLVVDQPATIGALPVAVARSEGVLVGYLPGLAMRRIADLHAGEAKTDARDAAIIAEAARTLPHPPLIISFLSGNPFSDRKQYLNALLMIRPCPYRNESFVRQE